MALTAISFVLGNILVVAFLQKKVAKRGIMFIGFALHLLGVYLMGLKPEKATSFELSALIVSGIPFYGLSIALISIPAMPEIILGVKQSEYSGSYKINILYNHLSGYFIIC